MTSVAAMSKAINTIAEFMTDIEEYQTKEGQIVRRNRLGYAQKRILNGICYAAAMTLQTTKTSHDEAVAKVRLAAKSHRGDELSEVQLSRAIDWAQRIETQIAHLEQVLEKGMQHYEMHTGECFTTPTVKPQAERKFQSAALEAAKRYGIDGEMTRGGGVEVASEEAA
jgi:hypothetical protein